MKNIIIENYLYNINEKDFDQLLKYETLRLRNKLLYKLSKINSKEFKKYMKLYDKYSLKLASLKKGIKKKYISNVHIDLNI